VLDTLQELRIPEEKVIYPSGEEHWFYTIKRLIIGKGGKANQILGVSIDITERKQTEIEVMKYRSHLERLVAERTTKISHTNELLQQEIGEILVKLCPGENNSCNMLVSDNGIGLPLEFDWQNPSTLGLKLVNVLARQLGVRVDLYQPKGTAFQITFPSRS
jgi:hypothetical protein